MNSGLTVETGGLAVLRITCTALCDRILLRTLYHDLQKLASSERDALEGDAVIHMQDLSLPSPTTSSHSGSDSSKGFWRQERLSRWIFSICFAESCLLLLMFVCQLLDALDAPTRNFNITWSLSTLILLALVVAPLMLFSFIVSAVSSRTRSWKTKSFITSCIYLIYLYALTHIPISKSIDDSGYLNLWLARLLALGIVIIGILSGVGVVRSSWSSIARLLHRNKKISKEDVEQAHRSLLRVQADLSERLQEQERRGAAPRSGGFVSRWLKTDESSALQHEINGLRTLEHHMIREYEQLCDRYAAFHQGFWIRCVSYALAVYCVLRVASSIRNLLAGTEVGNQQGPSSPDIAAQLLAWVLLQAGVAVNQSALARQLSLLFIGILIAVNIRVVLRECLRFLKLTDKQRGAPFMTLLCSQVMAMYFLATLVQLLAVLPGPGNAPGDTEGMAESVFERLPSFGLFSKLFDASFLLTAMWNAGMNSILQLIR